MFRRCRATRSRAHTTRQPGNRTLQGTGAPSKAARECLQRSSPQRSALDNAAPADLEMRGRPHSRQGAARAGRQACRGDSATGRSAVGIGNTPQPQRESRLERHDRGACVEVEVDRETGKVRILRYVSAHDVGRPSMSHSLKTRLEGGTIQGLALTQERKCVSTAVRAPV